MKPFIEPLKKAAVCLIWCLIILGYTWAILSSIDRITERKTSMYKASKKEYYVDIASDQTEIPRKYLGQTSYTTLAGDD